METNGFVAAGTCTEQVSIFAEKRRMHVVLTHAKRA
jgi:hypothetical protein